MKIFHLHYDLTLGGIETMLVNIANEQVLLGHDVTIIFLNRTMDPSLVQRIDKRIKIVKIGKKAQKKSFCYILKLNLYLLTHKYDILHVHNARFIRMLLYPVNQNHLCETQHCLCHGEADSNYCNRFKYNFAISESVRQDIWEKHHVKSYTVPNGIVPSMFKSAGSKYNEDGKFHIVQVGRLDHKVKGHDILICAVAELVKKGYNNVIVDFIGQGPSLQYLQTLCTDLGVEEKINFVGFKSQAFIADHLCQYDLFIQPSRDEGFGLTIAEAMAAKVPVLVSDNYGPMEVIDNGKYGCYFKIGDVADCVYKLQSIIENGYLPDMLEKAYERVCTVYNIKETAKTYCEYYKAMISKQSKLF